MKSKNLNVTNLKGKYRGKTGYSLQLHRLSHPKSQKITRSFKYPLYSDNQDLFNSITNSVSHDSVYLMGPQNLNEIESPVYSVLDFWMDALRIGGIFQPSSKALIEFVYRANNIPSPFESATSGLKKEFEGLIDQQKYTKLFYLKSGFKSTSTVKSIYNNVLKIFKDPVDSITDEYIKAFAQEIYLKDQVTQKTLIHKYFGTPKEITIPTTNLSFYIFPDIEIQEEADIFEIIDVYTHKNLTKLSSVDDLLGVGNNGNALSNFLGKFLLKLKSTDIDVIMKEMVDVCPEIWESKTKILRAKIEILQSCANKLENPHLANSWADYRSIFSGKIKSWLSNSSRQNEIISQHMSEALRSLAIIKNEIKDNKSKKLEELGVMVDELFKFGGKVAASSTNLDYTSYEVFMQLLSTFKSNINRQYQAGDIFSGERKQMFEEKLKKDRYKISELNEIKLQELNDKYAPDLSIDKITSIKPLFKKFRKPVSFYGKAKEQKFRKFNLSAQLIKTGVLSLKTLNKSIDSIKSERLEERQILSILDKTQANFYKANTDKYRNLYREFLLSSVSEISKTRGFSANNYSRNKEYSKINTPSAIETLDYLGRLEDIFIEQIADQSHDELIDFIELSKLLLNQKIILSKQVKFAIPKEVDLKNYPIAQAYIESIDPLSRSQFQLLINNFIISDLKGAINTISKKEIIVRNIILPISSENKFKLFVLKKKNSNINDNSNVKYKVSVNSRNIKALFHINDEDIVSAGKNKTDCFEQVKLTETQNIFDIRTSKYQLNLLRKSVFGNKDLSIKRNEPMLSVEKKFRIVWNFGSDSYQLHELSKSLYFIQPLTIDRRSKKDTQKTGIYMGIDIGEYGLAYCIYDSNTRTIITTGFIYDKQLRRLKEHVDDIKKKQVAGVFSAVNNNLINARETSVGTLRNRVHDLSIRYDATPVYERQVSAFESGAGKVSKIYNSVKRADIVAEIDADKEVKKRVWGNPFLVYGKEIDAYATSQTCSKCHKSVLHEIGANEEYEIKEFNELTKIGLVKWRNKSINFYDEKNTHLVGSKIKGSQLKPLIYNFMRPPLNSSVLKKYLDNLNLYGEKWMSPRSESERRNVKKFLDKNIRGNSAIFICPFCNHIADADIQAALNIAIKGYHQDLKKTEKDLEDFFEVIKNSNSIYPDEPIILTPINSSP